MLNARYRAVDRPNSHRHQTTRFYICQTSSWSNSLLFWRRRLVYTHHPRDRRYGYLDERTQGSCSCNKSRHTWLYLPPAVWEDDTKNLLAPSRGGFAALDIGVGLWASGIRHFDSITLQRWLRNDNSWTWRTIRCRTCLRDLRYKYLFSVPQQYLHSNPATAVLSDKLKSLPWS